MAYATEHDLATHALEKGIDVVETGVQVANVTKSKLETVSKSLLESATAASTQSAVLGNTIREHVKTLAERDVAAPPVVNWDAAALTGVSASSTAVPTTALNEEQAKQSVSEPL